MEKCFLSMSNNETNPSAIDRKSVLVIDDDKSILTSTCSVLEKSGFNVDVSETGVEAITKLKTRHFDVVLIDLKLPDMDGIEVLSKVNLQNTVKIMLTGYPSLVSGIQAMEKDVDAYLPKPVRPEELVRLIKSKLKHK
jgi:two-component system response regulator HydG